MFKKFISILVSIAMMIMLATPALADISVGIPYLWFDGNSMKLYSTIEGSVYGELNIGDEVFLNAYSVSADGQENLIGSTKTTISDIYQTDQAIYYNNSHYNLDESTININGELKDSKFIKVVASSYNRASNKVDTSYSIFSTPPRLYPSVLTVKKDVLSTNDLSVDFYTSNDANIVKIINATDDFQLKSDEHYIISGNKIIFKKSYTQTLSVGAKIFEIYDNLNNVSYWKLIIQEPNPPGSQGTQVSTTQTSTTSTQLSQQSSVKPKTQPKESTLNMFVDKENKKIDAELDKENLLNLISSQQIEKMATKMVEINIPQESGITSINFSIKKDVLSEAVQKLDALKVNTAITEITLPKKLLNNLAKEDIQLKINSIENKSNLPDSVAQELVNKPVVEVELIAGNQKIEDLSGNPIKINISYAPQVDEKYKEDKLVGVRIDDNGNSYVVKKSKYDPNTKKMVMVVDHLSRYSLMLNEKSFNDIFYSYAQKQIEFLSSRQIVNGTTSKTFKPKNSISRADFVLMMVRAFDLNASVEENFKDVKPDKYYYEAVGIAKKLGIVNGVGDNNFNPERTISREEMICIMARALNFLELVKAKSDPKILDNYSDSGELAAFAKDSAALLLSNNIIKGYNTKLLPKKPITREEAAVVLYNIYTNLLLK